jgi:hypothetical protein
MIEIKRGPEGVAYEWQKSNIHMNPINKQIVKGNHIRPRGRYIMLFSTYI